MTDLNTRYDGSEADAIGAAIYRRFPSLLNPVSEVLSRLFSIGRTYTLAQKYDITERAFASITNLLAEYLKLRRDNLEMPTSHQAMLLGARAPNFDGVLMKQLDQFSAIYKLAISANDEEICRQIIQCHRYLALAGMDTDGLYKGPGENPSTTYIVRYLDSITTSAAAHQLDDACLSGCRHLLMLERRSSSATST